MVLVPFGEYIPFGDTFPQFYSWSPYSGRFWKGENVEPLRLNGHALSVNICYEDIFPGHVRMLMQGGRERRVPDAMFNVTNDSWYGDTVQPMEHLVLASSARSSTVVRSSGPPTPASRQSWTPSAASMPHRQWTKASLVGRIPLMQGRTVYAVLGDWTGWACAIIALLGIGRAVRLSRRGREQGSERCGRNGPFRELIPARRAKGAGRKG